MKQMQIPPQGSVSKMTMIVLVFIVLLFSMLFIHFLRTPIFPEKKPIQYTVRQGASINSVIEDLAQQKIIQTPFFLKLLVIFTNSKHKLKAGEYIFPADVTPNKLLKQITQGKGLVNHPFTIIAGWNFKQLRSALSNEKNLKQTIITLSDNEIMQKLGAPNLSPEGHFYPDTYFFSKGSTDLALLKRAYHLMNRKLLTVWKERAPNSFYKNPQEALIAASLIEKETGENIERPVIASVIINRLKKNMLLQMDPTVIYALGNAYNGKLQKGDLLIKSPFNTYLYRGLPPAPIAIPSLDSLKAALHPDNNDYLYFVSRNYNSNGGHQFSNTYIQHEQAIDKSKRNLFPYDYFNSERIQFYFFKVLANREIIP